MVAFLDGVGGTINSVFGLLNGDGCLFDFDLGNDEFLVDLNRIGGGEVVDLSDVNPVVARVLKIFGNLPEMVAFLDGVGGW